MRSTDPEPGETMAQALSDIDARLFVGRTAELRLFETWLNQRHRQPGLLYIWGPGGCGKTALLRAFARTAHAAGRRVVAIDGRETRPESAALAAALGADELAAAVAKLNAERSVVLVDTFELLVDLTRVFLGELIPGLTTEVQVVIAGRHPLGLAWERWRPLLREVTLGGLADGEARTYLDRRGVRDTHLADQVLSIAGGLPLALSLVTDLVLQLGIRDLGGASEWHRVVRSLVEHLLADVRDPIERELLEAGAVVRQFDESLLAEVTGHADISAAFTTICQLSIVQVGRHGLLLHDDVRHILSHDLAWRHRDRYALLRLRALEAYRRRMRQASAAEREWLLAERLALWENAFVQAMLFTETEVGRVWLDWGGPEDRLALEALWIEWLDSWLGKQMRLHYDAQVERSGLRATLAEPSTRTRVARDADGRVVGFSTTFPLARDTLANGQRHPGINSTIQAFARQLSATELADTAAEANAYFFLNLVHSEADAVATQQALIRDVFGLLARGGQYVVATPVPAFKALFEALGFQRLPDAQGHYWSDDEAEEGFVLDLRQIGVERWIEAIVAGEAPPRPLQVDDIARSLQTILPRWRVDAALADSPLGAYLVPREQQTGERATSVRTVILEALRQLTGQVGGGEGAIALRAVEAAYITQRLTHERLAEDLGVSRSTLYRLLQRGIRDLALALEQAPQKPETV